MPDTFELTRFIIAFFASGIFWLMVLFYAEKRWREHGLPGAGVAAGIVLTAAGLLFFKVVVDDAPWKTPAPMWPDVTSYSAPAGSDVERGLSPASARWDPAAVPDASPSPRTD